MKTHLTKAMIPRGRRSLYTAVSPSANNFFDSAAYGPPPRSPVPPTLSQPSAQQSKSQSSQQQPATSLALATSPIAIGSGTPTPGSSRSPPNSASNIPPLFYPNQPGYYSPAFFPSILLAADRTQPRPVFRLESGGYGIPKTRKPSASTSTSAGTSTPSPPSCTPPPLSFEPLDLSVQVGDDSYFIRPNALGVADGVGGWASRPNGNSALFSRRLMHFCSHELSLLYPPPSTFPPVPTPYLTPSAILSPLPSHINPDPIEILQRSYEKTLASSEADGLLGSSTALLAILVNQPSTPHPQLRIAHLGDCLISLIRQKELIYRSTEQQHSFNYPVQLGPRSPSTPIKDARRIDLAVQEGDVIVVASDGLGDNLWDEDVLEEVRKWDEAGGVAGIGSLSEALAKRAKGVSESRGDGVGEIPFGRRAKEEGKSFSGGKADDISVLVAVIEGAQNPLGFADASRSSYPFP